MREYELKKLEFHKIKENLKLRTHSVASLEHIENIKPIPKEELLQEQKLVECFMKLLRQRENILYSFDDISKSLKKAMIEESVLGIDEILSIYKVLKIIKDVRKFLVDALDRCDLFNKILKDLGTFQTLEAEIERTIDNSGVVKSEASRDLFEIRKEIKQVEKTITEKLEALFQRPDSDILFSEKLITVRQNRYVVPVKTQSVKRIVGIVHGVSSSGFTTYLEPQIVVDLNNKLAVLRTEEEKEIHLVLKKLTSFIRERANRLLESFNTLVKIDILMAKASFGIEYECSLPSIGNCIELLEARNPIMSILSQNPIPVDIILKDKKGLVLTGPNTGGKTVFLKTLGLSYIMFLHAIPIPASPNSKLPIFDNIFVDIGDEQNISQSLSTFSSHIKNISEILQRSTEKTLILIDELGAGTDPLEGSALGIAILDYIKKLNAFVVVSTHHTPIKLWAVNSDYYEPATLMFDRDTLRPLYKVLYGTIGESMGIEVAKRFGIPKEVILEAQKLLGENTLEYQGVMENLNRLVREYQDKMEILEKHREELELLKRKYESLVEEMEKAKEDAWKNAAKEAQNYLEQLKKEAQEFLVGLKEKASLKDFIKQKQEELKKFEKEEEQQIEVGDWVEFMGGKGRVLEIRQDKAQVMFGDIKAWIKLKDLSKTTKIPRTHTINISLQKFENKKAGMPEINLTGLSVEEAISKLDKFLDSAFASGVKMAKVIHGVGVLKKAVTDYLSSSSYVVFYRDAYPKEGGSGTTVVYF